MEDPEFQEDGILLKLDFDDLGRLDWDNLFTGLPEASPPSLQASSSPANFCNSSPDSVSSWIGQLENILMKDDDNSVAVEPTQHLSNDFLADILVDSPPAVSAEVVDAATNRDSSAYDNGIGSASEREKDGKKVVDDGAEVRSDGQDPQDPSSKKRRRQLRNRDAALRSRERKKMYVRDLEMKSRYLEGECRRLGRLLQCVIAENQALHISLQKGNAFGVTSAKQESAVLLLESLLLGSLLWFLGIMCLFTQLRLPHSTPEPVSLENGEKEVPEGGEGSKMFTPLLIPSFVSSRRCKASRTRMKPRFIFIGDLTY